MPDSTLSLVGASGAIAGVLGAYLVLHPRVRVLVLIFCRFPLVLPAYLLLGLWLFYVANIRSGRPRYWRRRRHTGAFRADGFAANE